MPAGRFSPLDYQKCHRSVCLYMRPVNELQGARYGTSSDFEVVGYRTSSTAVVKPKSLHSLLVCASFAGFLVLGVGRFAEPARSPQGTASTVVSASSTPLYTTNFPLIENPLSEGGLWRHLDPTLTVVRTDVLGGVHVAHGTQTGSGGYDDSNAYLQGFSLNHSIEGRVWKSPSIPAGTPFHEIELLLRWSDDNPQRNTSYGPTSAEGYEINIDQNGTYLNLGTFKGPLLTAAASPPRPATGDLFKARIMTNPNGSATIKVYWNGVEKINYTHSTPITKGNPGIGFYIQSGGTNNLYGFSSITAISLDAGVPFPPTNVRIVR